VVSARAVALSDQLVKEKKRGRILVIRQLGLRIWSRFLTLGARPLRATLHVQAREQGRYNRKDMRFKAYYLLPTKD
jgi:hypothetical protein